MKDKLIRVFHIRGILRKMNLFLVNHVYVGTSEKYFEKKRVLLNRVGYKLGEGTKVVGPIYCTGTLECGKNCWLGKNLVVNGNGVVIIGDNCDIAPDVIFQTGGHEIGKAQRRAGEGQLHVQRVGDGVWIGGRVTIIGKTSVGSGSVIAGCACVINDVPENVMVGGVPAKIIRRLEND